MATSLSRASNNKIGTCPHGLPLGACPICNGMAGGGGSSVKKNKPPEMTWNECYAIGQMLKAQKLARQHTQQMFAAQDLQAHLNNLMSQINAMKMAAINNLPQPIAKAISILADAVLIPAVKVFQNISNTIQNMVSNISKTITELKQKIIDIADKLTAMLGEAKAAIQKKINEKFKDIKKKIFNLFGLVDAENEEDEELKRIEEEKRLFELNTAKEALFEIFTPKSTEEEESEDK